MRRTIPLLFLASVLTGALFMSGCKKNNPSVVGTWAFNNVAFNLVETEVDTDTAESYSDTLTMAYTASTKTVTQKTIYSNYVNDNDTVVVSPYALTIKINNDGTYAMTETSTCDSNTMATTTTGTWEYFSNNKANDNIYFSNGGSALLYGGYVCGYYYFGIGQSIYAINMLGPNSMVLSYNGTYNATNPGYTINEVYNASVAFSK